MFRLVLRLNEEDAYYIVLMPHQERALKKNEYLIFSVGSKKDFEAKLKDFIKNLIRIDGEVKNYKWF